jgi:ferredoxin-type protein NapH
LTQVVVLVLLVSPLAGLGLFRGNLAAADLFGLPLADPLAMVQVAAGARVFAPTFILSALSVACFYLLLGGRTFCSWVCPVYLLTELGDRLRHWTGTGHRTAPLDTKQCLLLATLVLTAITGLPLFETISPIGMVGRALVFGSLAPLYCLAGAILVEVLFARRLWCRSLCPLGGFYAILGRFAPFKVRFDRSRCCGCRACTAVCPVEEVLDPALSGGSGLVSAGDCTRCARCLDSCPTHALTIGFGYSDPGGGR